MSRLRSGSSRIGRQQVEIAIRTEIEGRIKLLVSLPVASLDKLTLSAELRRME